MANETPASSPKESYGRGNFYLGHPQSSLQIPGVFYPVYQVNRDNDNCQASSHVNYGHLKPLALQPPSLFVVPQRNPHANPPHTGFTAHFPHCHDKTSKTFKLLEQTMQARNVDQAWLPLEGKVFARLIDGTTVCVYNEMDIWAVETMHMNADKTCDSPATAMHLFDEDPEAPLPRAVQAHPHFPDISRSCSSSDTPISDTFGFSIWGRSPLFLIPHLDIHQDVTCSPTDSAFSAARVRWKNWSQSEDGRAGGKRRIEKDSDKRKSKINHEVGGQ